MMIYKRLRKQVILLYAIYNTAFRNYRSVKSSVILHSGWPIKL